MAAVTKAILFLSVKYTKIHTTKQTDNCRLNKNKEMHSESNSAEM